MAPRLHLDSETHQEPHLRLALQVRIDREENPGLELVDIHSASASMVIHVDDLDAFRAKYDVRQNQIVFKVRVPARLNKIQTDPKGGYTTEWTFDKEAGELQIG